jgi:hypothetical protein
MMDTTWQEMMGKSVYELEQRAWVAAHPAMRKAVVVVNRAEHEADLIDGILCELYEEANPYPPVKFPDEGKLPLEAEETEKKREEDEVALLAKLKEAVAAYGISAKRTPVEKAAEKPTP